MIITFTSAVLHYVYRNSIHMPVAQSTDDILKYFSDLFQKTIFDISCKLSPKKTVCTKCQTLLSEKINKLLSVEFTLSVVKDKLETISEIDINLEEGLYKPINANHC